MTYVETDTLHELRSANIDRQKEYTNNNPRLFSLLYMGLAAGGEMGELLNTIKKLERERLGVPGKKASIKEVSDEIADVIIYLDLIAQKLGINIGYAIREKFNETSKKLNFQTTMLT